MNGPTADPLYELLRPARRTAVVDVGASPIDGVPSYRPMLERGLCTVVGFEPQRSALDALRRQAGPLETYLPYALGDGTEQVLHVCSAPGMTSLLKPDARTLGVFQMLPHMGQVVASQPVQTHRLDAIAEIQALDLLTMDVQGSELAVLRSGREKVSRAVAVQTEVSFVPLYESQPLFGVIDSELRDQGFIPHAALDVKRWMISPLRLNNDPLRPLNQLLEADMVYVRDFRDSESLSDEQLRHLGLIAHHCYRSYDLALFCLLALERRGGVPSGVKDIYLDMLRSR